MPRPIGVTRLTARSVIFVMEALCQVLEDCFQAKLGPSYKDSIQTFRTLYTDLKNPTQSITPKAHILFEHVAPYCEIKNRGLGLTAEQAHEALHATFKKRYDRYIIKNIKNENYGRRLLSCVLDLNSDNSLSLK